jgi:hypothetical protein
VVLPRNALHLKVQPCGVNLVKAISDDLTGITEQALLNHACANAARTKTLGKKHIVPMLCSHNLYCRRSLVTHGYGHKATIQRM